MIAGDTVITLEKLRDYDYFLLYWKEVLIYSKYSSTDEPVLGRKIKASQQNEDDYSRSQSVFFHEKLEDFDQQIHFEILDPCFFPCVMLLKLSKKVHCLQFCADLSKKSKAGASCCNFLKSFILKTFSEIALAFLSVDCKTNILYVNINSTVNLFLRFGRYCSKALP